jgi:hypothetical protein
MHSYNNRSLNFFFVSLEDVSDCRFQCKTETTMGADPGEADCKKEVQGTIVVGVHVFTCAFKSSSSRCDLSSSKVVSISPNMCVRACVPLAQYLQLPFLAEYCNIC